MNQKTMVSFQVNEAIYSKFKNLIKKFNDDQVIIRPSDKIHYADILSQAILDAIKKMENGKKPI